MAIAFEDIFNGTLNADISSRAPDTGTNWVNTYSDGHWKLDGAGNATPGVSGGTPLGDASVDVVIPAGTSLLIVEWKMSVPNVSTENITSGWGVKILSAPGTLATGGISASIGSTGTNPSKNFNIGLSGTTPGGATTTTSGTNGSSTLYCAQEHIWGLEISAAGGAVLKCAGSPVLSLGATFLNVSGGFFTDYGVRLNMYVLNAASTVLRYMRVASNALTFDAPEVGGGGGGTAVFWTDFDQTFEVP